MKFSSTMSIAAGLLVIAACAPTPAGGPTGRDVPILKSDHLEKSWGNARVDALENGGHIATYRNPQTSLNLVIIESLPNAERVPRTAPPVQYQADFVTRTRPQQWRETTILGQTVKWFQVDEGGGADWPAFETVVFPLTHPDGRTGHYRIRVMADQPEAAAKLFPQVNW